MADEEDLAPTQTTGYKVGEKKTIAELATLDAQDESLKKWKESLGLGKPAANSSSDPRKVIVLCLALEVAGRPDVSIDLSTPGDDKYNTEALTKLKEQTIVIKEGTEYRLKNSTRCRIWAEILTRVDKLEEMVGSYGPSAEAYTKKFALEEAPSGMLARGSYKVKSRFVDDDNVAHLEWDWQMEIKKDW